MIFKSSSADPTVSAIAAVGSAIAVRVKGINAVVLRGDEDHVPGPLPWNDQAGDVQRLGINLAIHGIGEQSAETVGVNIRQRDLRLVGILARAGKVIMPGEHIYLAEAWSLQTETTRYGDREGNSSHEC